ncbi:phosphate-binding protein [Methanocella sp. CWC-04]|uniref:Phosphate-binding protein n=1 Tax=Methanooceanicella nereidis TaxID=2052831 RepID=A0AAP2W849_9EURY|nr:phosphate ABC transporter substrate-binding protein [Methanocella sp. CWC-04]MCD1295721.1 phosphate-binding protein [Methanocella sp. CWC-04]
MFNKKSVLAILAIAIISISAFALGCTQETPTATPTPAATGEPTLSGSIQVTGSTSVQPYADELALAFEEKYRGTRVLVSGIGSGPGIKATADGTCDMGMSSRELKAEEEAQDLKPHIIAYDGIAIIVNKANPVSDLTTDNIKEIFAGNITNWKDVGGNDAQIVVVTREAGSGTRGAFEELVMQKGSKANITMAAIQQGSNGQISTVIKGNTNAIGYISFGTLSDDVKALKVDGIAPSVGTIKDKTYSIQRPFLFVTKGNTAETNALVKAFLEFTLGSEGQAVLQEGNLVSPN